MNATGAVILLVEDELAMRRFLRAALIANGYRLVEAVTAAEGLALASSHNPDVIVLDLGLPDGDGIDVTRTLRTWYRGPIVVLSARGREEDKVAALDAGADDYLTKPFGIQELLARLRVALRHRDAPLGADPVVDLGGLRVDLASRVVSRGGTEIHLTPIEFRLLALLIRHAGKVLTHRMILTEVWGPGAAGQTHYVRVHMAELRRKIEVDPARPRLIVTEPGVGYRLQHE